jgi:hypothetical protein
MKHFVSIPAIFLLSVLFIADINLCFAVEIITQDEAPYTYEEANWRVGNYIQALFYDYSDLPALSENFIGNDELPVYRLPDLYYIGNTGLDLLSFCEEAIHTPVVRIELIKKIFKAMYDSHYRNADALWLVYSGSERQVSFLSPTHEPGPNFGAASEYPESKLIARNLPDTAPEKLALIWPRVQINGKWYDDSDMQFDDLKYNVADKRNGSFTTERLYTCLKSSPVKIRGIGWNGFQDKVLELTLSIPADPNRQKAQLVFSNLTDKGMGFSAPYPTEIPETIQLSDGSEISSRPWSVKNPDYNYLIIYTKDADMSGFEYQNAMIFGWREKPSKIIIHWESGSEKSFQEAYPGTEGKTDVIPGSHSGGFYRVDFEYDDKTDISKNVWMERFQGVDPSLSLSHLHHIARNICSNGKVGMSGYLCTESAWLEEPVCAFPAAAYILALFDKQEDEFGGDFSEKAVNIATKLVDDRIAMWKRGRKSGNYHEYGSGAYYLSMVYDMPGRFNNPERRDYYKKWMKIWADRLVEEGRLGPRDMMTLTRVYELTQDPKYKQAIEKGISAFAISEKEGLFINGKWISPRDFYSYGDVMGALGRRGRPEDVKDIQKLITYLTNQKRWTDTGYMGYWWEVTIENHNFFGRWCKALDMVDVPKRFFSVSEFPVYYKQDGKTVVEMSEVPPFYNPDYYDKVVMQKYLPILPRKLVSSVIFRVDNILLKRDYANDWWRGTDNSDAIRMLAKIKENMLTIKKNMESEDGRFVCDADMKKLLVETDSLFNKAMTALDGAQAEKEEKPAGNPTSLEGELHFCKFNFRHLENVLRKQK